MCHYYVEGSSSLVCAIHPEEMPDDYDLPPAHAEEERPEGLHHSEHGEMEVGPEGPRDSGGPGGPGGPRDPNPRNPRDPRNPRNPPPLSHSSK